MQLLSGGDELVHDLAIRFPQQSKCSSMLQLQLLPFAPLDFELALQLHLSLQCEESWGHLWLAFLRHMQHNSVGQGLKL
eukprot:CAMPEP_0202360908 /NCGR_PEP_ID=MMETSP1126-20121109/13674_1 /ASSEMBLY_ACC=CAM_ASM_000457 /TAXON_ID=3047 /ORGANISM="Dunaliella tertiolecta, Strain CCMP1320" /LENGTH=78 /DNA_ID=CAMNT_0048954737 /DNA_START=663 /DNA_END=899 /DNA_ORIENTATION=+